MGINSARERYMCASKAIIQFRTYIFNNFHNFQEAFMQHRICGWARPGGKGHRPFSLGE